MTQTDTQVIVRAPVNPIEDIPPMAKHQFIVQADRFYKSDNNPRLYYAAVVKSLPQVPGVEAREAMHLLEAIETRYVNVISMEYAQSNRERLEEKNTKARKPKDIFLDYKDDLLTMWRRNGGMALVAHSLYTELYLEQTQSEGNLSRDYIDPYTGEKDVEEIPEDRDLEVYIESLNDELKDGKVCRDRGAKLLFKAIAYVNRSQPKLPVNKSQRELLEWGTRLKNDLNFSDEQVQQFINAQTSFDNDSDEIALPDDDTDAYTPPTLLPNEFVINRELWFSATPAIGAFNRTRSKVFKHMRADGVRKNEWHFSFRNRIQRKDAFCDMVQAIERVAAEDVITAAALYLSVAGDYGIMKDDAAHISGAYHLSEQWYRPEQIGAGWSMSLVNFAEEWENDLLTLAQDSLAHEFPMSEKEMEQYDILVDHVIEEGGEKKVIPAAFRATMSTYDPNPINTAAYNIGFARAAAAGGTWRDAENSGWENWRQEMDPKAAKAYNEAIKAGKNRVQAMTAFWKVCDKRVPRPQCAIANIAANKAGLNICPPNKQVEKTTREEWRFIDWNVVKIKLLNEELVVDGDIKARLLKVLKELDCGQSIWFMLA